MLTTILPQEQMVPISIRFLPWMIMTILLIFQIMEIRQSNIVHPVFQFIQHGKMEVTIPLAELQWHHHMFVAYCYWEFILTEL